MPRHTPNAADADALRLVMQYREKNGMAYELECRGTQLSVRIAPRESAADPSDWLIEARVGRTSESACVAGWAETRRGALREVAQRWDARKEADGLPSFDWEAVATALQKVRAV